MKEVRQFQVTMIEFKGVMIEFKDSTNRRLSENKQELEFIKGKLVDRTFCPVHSTVVSLIEKEQKVNEEQAKAIQESEKSDLKLEARLSPIEKTQLNAVTLMTVVNTFLNIVLIWLKTQIGG